MLWRWHELVYLIFLSAYKAVADPEEGAAGARPPPPVQGHKNKKNDYILSHLRP